MASPAEMVVDGSVLEGGGQILRVSIALATLLEACKVDRVLHLFSRTTHSLSVVMISCYINNRSLFVFIPFELADQNLALQLST